MRSANQTVELRRRLQTDGRVALCAASGILACLDGYMNIAMEQTEEYVNGELTNKYGDCFIRGNNGERTRLRALCPLLTQ